MRYVSYLNLYSFGRRRAVVFTAKLFFLNFAEKTGINIHPEFSSNYSGLCLRYDAHVICPKKEIALVANLAAQKAH